MSIPGARVMLARFPALLRLPAHVHDRPCVTVVIEGAFVESLGGRERYCGRGAILAKTGLERHGDLFARTGSRQIIVEADESQVDLLQPCRVLLTSVSHFSDGEIEQVAQQLAQEIERPDSVTPMAAAALTFELLVRATRTRATRSGRLGTPPRWLEQARELLSDCFREAPSLGAIATTVGVHPAYLARLFRIHYRCSVGTYVRRLRLEAAAAALTTSDAAIARIALGLGFSDQSHFTRQFRRHFGLTPSDYRQQGRVG